MITKLLHQDPFSGAGMDQGTIIPWYNQIYTNNPTQAGYRPDLDLNDTWEQPLIGNLYKFAYLDVSGETPSVLSAGVALTLSTPGTDTVSASLTDPVSGLVYGITLVTGGLTANAEVGNYLYMEDLGLMKQIKSNTETDVIFSTKDTLPTGYDVEAIDPGPANASNISIIRPGHVVVNATPGVTVGVTVNDVTEGQFIVMQVRGLALIVGNNSGTALVANTPALITTGAILDGGDPSGQASMQDCLIVPLVSYTGANILIPCYFRASGT
jgi:hypothetical protein